jgi:hypothetical protein
MDAFGFGTLDQKNPATLVPLCVPRWSGEISTISEK